jgi:hypothetical protein
LSVSVKNLRSNVQRTDITGKNAGEGRYSIVFDDLVENSAAKVGDELHITVTDPRAAFGARIMTYQLTPEDIRSGVISLDIQMSSTPVVSSLLPPYPIPFNPDVWLPYQLAKPADVEISIYDIQGRLVRKLDIGQRPAGTYMTRDDAAHWDGKNTDGETIAPGIYFYSIRAGKFVAKATGKLVFLPK